jgi:hypothetical protein
MPAVTPTRAGHAYKRARAKGVTARISPAAVPYLAGARGAASDGYISGGTRRNLDWVLPHATRGSFGEFDRLLLADTQASAGLLLAGEGPARSSSSGSSSRPVLSLRLSESHAPRASRADDNRR